MEQSQSRDMPNHSYSRPIPSSYNSTMKHRPFPALHLLDGAQTDKNPLHVSRNPHPFQTLESAFSNLNIDGFTQNSHNNSNFSGSALSGFNVERNRMKSAPHDAQRLLDQQSSLVSHQQSIFQDNLPHRHYIYPSYSSDGFYNFAGYASSSSSNNLVSGGHGSSGRRLDHTHMSGLLDSSATEYRYQRHQQQISRLKFTDRNPNPMSRIKYPHGQNRSYYNKLELDSNSINPTNWRGNVVAYAKDQKGRRILQSKFQDPKSDEIEIMLSEVLDHVPELMVHYFGNDLIQKLIQFCDEEQRLRLLLSIIRDSRQLINTCFDNHGTRVVQKLLDKLTSPQQIHAFMLAIAPGTLHLIKDMNGHHVIQQCLKNFSAQQNEYLLHEVAEHCFDIATDKSGCCVLQQCVDKSEGEARESLLYKIVLNALQLAEDCYGNYVVQHVLDMNEPGVNRMIVNQLRGSFVQLSCNRFGSHVVEKCLNNTDMNETLSIIWELLWSRKASELLVDPFGNFIIQASLSAASQGEIYNALMRLIIANARSMQTNMFGKKVLEWFPRNARRLVWM